jgi:hypothetical protein
VRNDFQDNGLKRINTMLIKLQEGEILFIRELEKDSNRTALFACGLGAPWAKLYKPNFNIHPLSSLAR